MFTDKRNILQLAALLKAHGIRKIVISPGSRNIPITKTLLQVPDFTCYPVTDERSAGFFALGLSLHGGTPAAIVCTSGSALLNIFSAVSEAYYQQVPLVVISADRPAAWIGQMDGQTMPQSGIFGSLVKMSVSLPDIKTDEDEWHCNRLINEAILETTHHGRGPVHINVPVSEPLFNETVAELPVPRVIRRYQGLNKYEEDFQPLIDRLNKYKKRLVVAGQMNMIYLFDKKYSRLLGKQFAWFTENLSNRTIPGQPIRRIDELLYPMDKATQENMRPDLLITFGGHVISRRLKYFLRNHKPTEHWHVASDGAVADLYGGALTTVIEMDPFEFWERMATLIEDVPPAYPRQWETLAAKLPQPDFSYSEMYAVGALMEKLPSGCSLHLGNGSAVRYAQMFSLPDDVEVLSNRGINGIDGSVSTALGYSVASDRLNFLLVGDLGFFYDLTALWNSNYGSNIRILLLNNGGGELFQALPKLELDDRGRRFVAGTHSADAAAWAQSRGFRYAQAHDKQELDAALAAFTEPSIGRQPQLLEVFTDKASDVEMLRQYYHSLRK